MELSIFNISKEVGKEIIVFNTLTKALIKLSADDWQAIVDNPNAFNSNHTLCKLGIICKNKDSQIQVYKLGYYQNAFNRDLLSISVAPTMKCNFNCSYCFEGNNKNFGAMNTEIQSNLISFIKHQYPKKVWINWFGGEPLLAYNQIRSICNLLKEEQLDFVSSMVTNGSLLSDKIVNQLEELSLQFIQISMDGVAKDHDLRRCFKDGSPSFNIIMNNISYLLKTTSIPTIIQVTVDHNNECAYNDMVLYCKDRFNEYYTSGQLTVSINYVKDRLGIGEKSSCYSNDDFIAIDILRLKSGNKSNLRLPGNSLPCMYRSISNFAIDSRGFIYKCLEQLGNPKEAIGSIKNGTLSVEKLAAHIFGNEPFNDPNCQNCNILPICGGGCPLDRCKVAKNSKHSCCSLYKDRFQDLLPYYYNSKYNNSTI